MNKWDRNAAAFILLDLPPSDRIAIVTGICETVSILPNPRFVTPGWHVFVRSALSIYDLDALVCTIYIWNNRYISTCVIWNDIIIDYIVTFWHYTTEYHYKASLADIPFNESSEMRRCYITLRCNLFSKMTWRIKMHGREVTLASMYINIS